MPRRSSTYAAAVVRALVDCGRHALWQDIVGDFAAGWRDLLRLVGQSDSKEIAGNPDGS
jgi:hypothetical protein